MSIVNLDASRRLLQRRIFRRQVQDRRVDLANSASIANEDASGASSIAAQKLPPIKYPIRSTGEPNPMTPYTRYRINPTVDIAKIPSVVGVGPDDSQTRSILPQVVRPQRRRMHRQSHIGGRYPSNLPAVLNFQKKIQRFYLQKGIRPLANIQKNLRIARRRLRI